MTYATPGSLFISRIAEDDSDAYTGHLWILNEVAAVIVFEFSGFVVDSSTDVSVGVGTEFDFLNL